MAKKLTKGWAVYRPEQDGLSATWFYTTSGAPFKRRGDALKLKNRLVDWYWKAELYQVSSFYEVDNG